MVAAERIQGGLTRADAVGLRRVPLATDTAVGGIPGAWAEQLNGKSFLF